MVSLILGECLAKMKEMDSNSVDSIVTDPPYGISFMAKRWDYDIPSVEIWKECFRILKPGGHILSFGGSRTFHRIAVNIEDAGFEIRDTLMWIYGSGFPKSHNIGKAIDKKLGNEREPYERPDFVSRSNKKEQPKSQCINGQKSLYTKGTSEYEGWGTALKPAHEPIIMARKPFKGDVATNVFKYGTGGINIDECRVGDDEISTHNAPKGTFAGGEENRGSDTSSYKTHVGRWPANVLHDGSEEVVSLFPNTKSGKMGPEHNRHTNGSPNGIYGKFDANHPLSETYGDSSSAARFFYCAKASKKDRNEGCEDLEEKPSGRLKGRNPDFDNTFTGPTPMGTNHHPTVKPTELMRYLCRLVTPKNGIVLDPFMGSGSTGKAAILEGFSFIGIEMDEEYFEIAKRRAK